MTRRVALLPPTLGLYLDALTIAGVSPSNVRPDAFDAKAAGSAACIKLIDCLLSEPPAKYRNDTELVVAQEAWEAFVVMVEPHCERSDATVEIVRQNLGFFDESDKPVTLERVLYSFDFRDVMALREAPLWLALEYLGVRGVESTYRDEMRKLAQRN